MTSAAQIRYTILAVQREANRQLAEQLKRIGLTPSQAEVIRVLNDWGALSLSALGDLLICESGNNPSRLVDRLVTAGLLVRTTSTADRRQIEVTLSALGRSRNKQIEWIEDALYADLERKLTTTDLSALQSTLAQLIHGSEAGASLRRRFETSE